jgi:hypothetical protein
VSRRRSRRRRGWTVPLGVKNPLLEEIAECPQMNPRVDFAREIASMVARTIHPGKAGPLNISIDGPSARKWWAS